MPLRRWFAGRGLPGWYSWVVVVLLSLTTSAASLVISIHVIHAQRAADLRQQQQGRQVTCAVVTAQDDAFTEAIPATNAGRRAAEAWHRLREQLNCDHA